MSHFDSKKRSIWIGRDKSKCSILLANMTPHTKTAEYQNNDPSLLLNITAQGISLNNSLNISDKTQEKYLRESHNNTPVLRKNMALLNTKISQQRALIRTTRKIIDPTRLVVINSIPIPISATKPVSNKFYCGSGSTSMGITSRLNISAEISKSQKRKNEFIKTKLLPHALIPKCSLEINEKSKSREKRTNGFYPKLKYRILLRKKNMYTNNQQNSLINQTMQNSPCENTTEKILFPNTILTSFQVPILQNYSKNVTSDLPKNPTPQPQQINLSHFLLERTSLEASFIENSCKNIIRKGIIRGESSLKNRKQNLNDSLESYFKPIMQGDIVVKTKEGKRII